MSKSLGLRMIRTDGPTPGHWRYACVNDDCDQKANVAYKPSASPLCRRGHGPMKLTKKPGEL